MNDSPGKGAWVALCTKTSYLQGLLVLNHSLRAVNSAYPLVAMITAPFPKEARAVCEHAGIRMKEVESLLPKEGTHQLNEHDLRFIDTWTKFRFVRCFLFSLHRACLLTSVVVELSNGRNTTFVSGSSHLLSPTFR